MLLADKIIEERKKQGLSQEELAERLSVSRQAVSKWESAQSVPDLQRILAMSELFSVSTDYLLKEDAENERVSPGEDAGGTVRRVSMEEANDYLSAMERQSRSAALGALLCILCPVLLIFLNGLAEGRFLGLTETVASAIGLSALFLQVAAGVFLFVRDGSKTEGFAYLQREEFETAYGVTGLAKEKKAAFEPTYLRFLPIGIILCVLSPLPLIVAALIHDTDVLLTSTSALLLCMIAVGVYLIVRVATVRVSYQVLLQEGAYHKAEKRKNNAVSAVSGVYWCLVTAGYLAWSFVTGDWKTTWIIWPVAGVLCAPVMTIARQFMKREENT